MYGFFSEITPEQAEVIKAIDKLLKISDLDTVKRTYAEAIHEELRDWWAKGWGLKRSSGRAPLKITCVFRPGPIILLSGSRTASLTA
ncbi:MAG: hypothetical protein QME78_00250 [Thermodesulfobacteriota bacterium]|nr:hypothetical protein [Thermodesulfobacteriota bacterium]